MKKLTFILISTLVLTGCSNTFTYEFKDDTISSTIEINFSDSEYKTYQEKFAEEYNNDVYLEAGMQTLIKDTYDTSSALAYKDENGKYHYYKPVSYNRDNTNNTFTYNFGFTYEAFKNNYYINDCFEYFTTTEDDKYYYYNISGAFTCENASDHTFKIKADNKIAKSNSDDVNKNIHSWNIKKNENDIYFVISKTELNNKGVSKVTIIAFVIIILLALISLIMYKKVEKDY